MSLPPVTLIPGTPYAKSSGTQYTTTETSGGSVKKKSKLSPGVIWTIAIVLIVIIVLFVLFYSSRQQPEPVNVIFNPDMVILDDLVNLTFDGQCCIPNNSMTPTPRWVYDSATDFTYSLDPLDPDVACASLVGTEQSACINRLSDANGDPKYVAHRGIVLYYGFSPGQANSICSSFTPCSL